MAHRGLCRFSARLLLGCLNLLAACRRDLLRLRDRALLLVAYDSGCRRSELVAVRAEDVDGPDRDGVGALFIPMDKTDRERAGRLPICRRERLMRSSAGASALAPRAVLCSSVCGFASMGLSIR